jgi:hypothetical protein
VANNIAYFQSPGIELGKALYSNGAALVKRAIIAIEGRHKCNRGKTYDMPAPYIQELADNTNQQIALGREIPLFRDHNKSAESKFGTLTGLVECRPIGVDDLPDPAATGMLGKLAIFANANITNCVDLVNSKAIKPLSPGIDIVRKLIFEVSAVPIGSMPGVAFFGYEEIKAQKLKYGEIRDSAIDAIDTLIEAFRQSEQQQEGEQVGGDLTYKQMNFESFVEDLREIFELPKIDPGMSSAGRVTTARASDLTYNTNPYDRAVVRGSFGYDLKPEEKEAVLTETAAILRPTSAARETRPAINNTKRSRGKPAIGGLGNGKGRGG